MKQIALLFHLLTALGSASADELHLVISGKAIHSGSKNYNEENWGFGIEYDFRPRGNWIPFATAVTFKDSNNETSNYAGGGAKYRFNFGSRKQKLHFDVGVVGFLMTRKDRNDNKPFPGVLPFVSLGNDWAALNITYIPPVSPKMVGLVYFQAMFRILEFK